jgi:hypothetical protein
MNFNVKCPAPILSPDPGSASANGDSCQHQLNMQRLYDDMIEWIGLLNMQRLDYDMIEWIGLTEYKSENGEMSWQKCMAWLWSWHLNKQLKQFQVNFIECWAWVQSRLKLVVLGFIGFNYDKFYKVFQNKCKSPGDQVRNKKLH